MELGYLLRLAKNNLKNAILIGLLFAAFSFFALVSTQKNYKATLDLLIVQNQAGSADYYALSRSADYLTNIMTETVYSEKFLDEVMATGKISRPFLASGNLKRLKEWQKTVSVKKNSSVGIVNIKVFADSENQAAEITSAVSDVLVNKNALFLGEGQNIEVRTLSGPIIEKNPSVSQMMLASAGGMLAGMFFCFLIVFYRAEINKTEQKNIYRGKFDMDFNHNEQLQKINLLEEERDYWKEELQKMRA